MPPNDPYGRQLLEKIAEETDENNKMLKGIRNYIRWASFYGWLKFAVIVCLVLLGYFQLKPYFAVIESGYYNVIETGKAILNINATINPGTTATSSQRTSFTTNPAIKNIFDRIRVPTDAPNTPTN